MLPEEYKSDAPPLAGYVYLMRNEHDDYKIGHSVDPLKRRQNIAYKTGHKRLSIVLTIPTPDMIGLELMIQRRYQHLSLGGEWYRLSKQEVTEIRLIRLQVMCESEAKG